MGLFQKAFHRRDQPATATAARAPKAWVSNPPPVASDEERERTRAQMEQELDAARKRRENQ